MNSSLDSYLPRGVASGGMDWGAILDAYSMGAGMAPGVMRQVALINKMSSVLPKYFLEESRAKQAASTDTVRHYSSAAGNELKYLNKEWDRSDKDSANWKALVAKDQKRVDLAAKATRAGASSFVNSRLGLLSNAIKVSFIQRKLGDNAYDLGADTAKKEIMASLSKLAAAGNKANTDNTDWLSIAPMLGALLGGVVGARSHGLRKFLSGNSRSAREAWTGVKSVAVGAGTGATLLGLPSVLYDGATAAVGP
jgi:hypothetical protein